MSKIALGESGNPGTHRCPSTPSACYRFAEKGRGIRFRWESGTHSTHIRPRMRSKPRHAKSHCTTATESRPSLSEIFETFLALARIVFNILDHRTGERRQPLLQDVVEGITLCDALPHIDFVMGMFLPEDVARMTADRYVMETMLRCTSKPIIFVTTDLAGCVDAVEMAEVVVGGSQALQQKPLAACYINVTNGLQHNEEALQKILYLSGKGLPTTYIPVALGGATAPITLAGNMAIWNAGGLVGLVLSQLNHPGAPFITSGWGASALDMRTTVSPYVEPEKQFIAQELAHFYDLPMFAFGGCSDSKLADQQASLEAALTLMTNVLSGSHLIHDLGYLESGLTGSLAQLAICNELISWIKEALRPVEINDDTLALDVIDKVGPEWSVFRQRTHPDPLSRSVVPYPDRPQQL